MGAEVSALIHETIFRSLKAPVQRVGSAYSPVPFSPALEKLFLYSAITSRRQSARRWITSAMATELRIPKLGIAMTEATLSEWLVPDGAAVEAGMQSMRSRVDKSTNEIEAPVGGVLKVIGQVGEVYEIGALIATIE